MKKSLMVLMMAMSGTAVAGTATVASTVQQDFTITYAKQSGEDVTSQLSKGTGATGYTSVYTPDKGSVAITVSDGTGAVVAKGKVTDDGHYVLLPKGSGFVLTPAGTLSGPWAPYPGVVIVNTLPDAYTVDLFGDTGKVGLKGVKPSKTMTVKDAIKLPAGDDHFKAMIHLPDGTSVESQSHLAIGWYYVIHKTYDDKVTISALGWMEPPPKKQGKK